MSGTNKQAKGKDPATKDYGGPTTIPSPDSITEQRGYSGWERPVDTPRSFNPPSEQPTIYQPDSKDTKPNLINGARRPPYFVQPGADRDRPNIPKTTIEPVRSYGYAPSKRATPTKDVPGAGPRSQFTLPLSGEQTTGDPITQGEPSAVGNGSSPGPGGHGPIRYIDVPSPKAPPSATKQPPFDIVKRGKAEVDLPMRRADGPTIDPINFATKPKTGIPAPAYGGLPRSLRQPTLGIIPKGSGTTLPLPTKGLTQIGYTPKPKAQPHRQPADGPQVPNRNYATPTNRAGKALSVPLTYDPGGLNLFRRQRKPDPDETKSGNQ